MGTFNQPVEVVCVCTGTKYPREYVEKLHNCIKRWWPADEPFRFTVFTDNMKAVLGFDNICIINKPEVLGYWNKLTLFAPEAFPIGTPVMYFDLDNLIRGPLKPLIDFCWDKEFVMASDPIMPDRWNSSVMFWRVSSQTQSIWTRWVKNNMPIGRAMMNSKGDQAWIERRLRDLGITPALWQHTLPDAVRNFYKPTVIGSSVHPWLRLHDPGNASVVIFHGRPRLHELDLPWVVEAWR